MTRLLKTMTSNLLRGNQVSAYCMHTYTNINIHYHSNIHSFIRSPLFALLTADDISDKGDSDQIKTVFQNDQGKKTIDVYWIADDGGGHKEGLNLTKQASTKR